MNKSKFLEEWEKLITVCILVILVVLWGLKLTEFLPLNIFATCLISSVIIACVGLVPMLVWLIMGIAQLITDAPKKFYSVLMIVWVLPVALIWFLELIGIISLSSFWLWVLVFYPFVLLFLTCFIFGIVFIIMNLTNF